MAYNSTNPVFQPKFWNTIQGNLTMSYEGTLQKIGILFGIMTLSSLATISIGLANPVWIEPMMGIGFFGSVGIYIYLLFTRPANPKNAVLIYALLEGMFIGPLTLIFEIFYPEIALQACFATIGVIGAMLTIYSFRIIRPTPTFNKIVYSLTLSIMFIYLIDYMFYLFAPGLGIPFLHSSGPIGIAVSVVFISVASMMLISNFGSIEAGVRMGAPKQQEWWAGFGILLTVIWLYIEMLRLIAKLRDNR